MVKITIKCFLTAIIFFIISYNIDFEIFFKLFKNLNITYILYSIGLLIIVQFIVVYRMNLLLNKILIKPFEFLKLLKIHFQGLAISLLIPLGPLGGDLWKIFKIKDGFDKNILWQSSGAIFLDRLSGLHALLIIIPVAGLASSTNFNFGHVNSELIYSLSLFLFLIPFFLNLLKLNYFKNSQFIYIIQKFFSLSEFFKYIFLIRYIAQLSILSIFSQLLALFAFWICFLGVDQLIPFNEFLLAGSIVFIASILPISIAGFGARDATTVILFNVMFDISNEITLVATFCYGVITILINCIGIFLFDSIKISLNDLKKFRLKNY